MAGAAILLALAALASFACKTEADDDPPPPITYNLDQSGGTNGSADSTGIIFTFSADPGDLSVEEITVPPSTIANKSGALTGSGTTRTLPITVNSAGDATVTIAKAGIVDTAHTVTVFKSGESVFVRVTNITGGPTAATAGTPLTLTGTVVPSGATNNTITWSVKSAGTTGASISGSTFNATAAGTAVVTATIANGLTASSDYVQDFNITVSDIPKPAKIPNNWKTMTGAEWQTWFDSFEINGGTIPITESEQEAIGEFISNHFTELTAEGQAFWYNLMSDGQEGGGDEQIQNIMNGITSIGQPVDAGNGVHFLLSNSSNAADLNSVYNAALAQLTTNIGHNPTISSVGNVMQGSSLTIGQNWVIIEFYKSGSQQECRLVKDVGGTKSGVGWNQ